MEQEAWNQDILKDLQEGEHDQKKYEYFMKNEPRQKDTEIFIEEEPGPSQGLRYTKWKIGMVRGAKDEDKKWTKVYLDPIPHTIIENSKQLQGWYKAKVEPPNVRARPCFTDAILTEPYGGYCNVGCAFCYINHGMKGYRGQGLTTVPRTYGEDVARQLKKMRTSAAGYFSSFTDPFLPLEDLYHNTQKGATAFVNEGLPIFFLSRLRYPGWAYDLLKQNKYSYAQMSINCFDPEDWKRLSPRAQPLEDMFEQVRELHRQGIYVSIQVNPIVPGVVDNDDVVKLIHKLAECGADHLIFKFVEISYSSRNALVEQINRRFGNNRGGVFKSLFTCNIGHQATVDEEYRKAALDLFYRECKKAGVTSAVCYEYEFERDGNGEIVNTNGVSMGSKYLTGDQCHGHRVPLFTRVVPDAPFSEVAECPPSGCLTCGDENNVGKCGSSLFGQAKALRYSDLKKGVYDK